MGTKEWLDNVEAKCNIVVDAYTDLFSQISTMDKELVLTEYEIEELEVVVAVKLGRLSDKIERILFPEPECISVDLGNGGVQ